jgi:hypothetical protein
MYLIPLLYCVNFNLEPARGYKYEKEKYSITILISLIELTINL